MLPLPVKRDKLGRSTSSYSHRDWFEKIMEEVFEAHEARGDDRAIELVDVITVCVSYLDCLGYDADAREELYRHVNQKNERRGYFKCLEDFLNDN